MKYNVDTEAQTIDIPADAKAVDVQMATLRHPGYRPIVEGDDITDVVHGLPLMPRMEVVYVRPAGQPATDNRQPHA